jgi:hypothetical protein
MFSRNPKQRDVAASEKITAESDAGLPMFQFGLTLNDREKYTKKQQVKLPLTALARAGGASCSKN